jgi:hypothetical protein
VLLKQQFATPKQGAACDLYEARIQGYQKNPPPEDCNGAFALPTK